VAAAAVPMVVLVAAVVVPVLVVLVLLVELAGCSGNLLGSWVWRCAMVSTAGRAGDCPLASPQLRPARMATTHTPTCVVSLTRSRGITVMRPIPGFPITKLHCCFIFFCGNLSRQCLVGASFMCYLCIRLFDLID
jgi:hypothetical protein